MAKLCLLLLTLALFAACQANVLKSIKHDVQKVLKETGKGIKESRRFFVKEFNEAKEVFEKVIKSKEFHMVVDELIPLIDSEYTEGACNTVCIGASETILGPEATFATDACPPLCKGALSKLKNLVLKNYQPLPESEVDPDV